MKPAQLLPVVFFSSLLGLGPARAAEPTELILHAADAEDYFDILSSVAAIGEDQFIAVGYRGGIDGFRCWMVRARAGNRVIWEKAPCSEPGVMLWDVTRLSGGDYVAAGYLQGPMETHSDAFAIRFHENGVVAWQRRYATNRHERLYFVEVLGDGTLAVGGRSAEDAGKRAPTEGLVLLLSAVDGEQLRRFAFPSSTRERAAFFDGVQVEDGNLVLVGFETDEGTGNDDVWVLKTGLQGSRLWERRFGGGGDDLGHEAVALPRSGVGVFGWGAQRGSDQAGGLFLELDRDGSLLRQRLYSVGTGGNDRFRDAIALEGGQFLVVGQASFSREAPNLGWFVRLSSNGDLIREEVLSDLAPGRLYGIALSHSGAVQAVGLSVREARRKPDGWLVDLGEISVAKDRQADFDLVFAGERIPGCGQIQAGAAESVCPFTLDTESRVWVSLLPLTSDIDLTLTDAAGSTIGVSDNQGTAAELVEGDLVPGDYVIHLSRFSGGRDVARFRVRVTIAPSSAGAAETEGEESWTDDDRVRIEHALALIGYRTGPVDGFFGASTRRAIRALQAALGEEPSGFLTGGQRLHLAVFAALAAEERAREAVDSSERLVRGAKLRQQAEATAFGASGSRETKLVEGIYYGFFHGAGDLYYSGTWSDVLKPEGFGAVFVERGNRKHEWAGELAGGDVGRYGVTLVDGIRVDIGERESDRSASYSIERNEGIWIPRGTGSDGARILFKAELFEEL